MGGNTGRGERKRILTDDKERNNEMMNEYIKYTKFRWISLLLEEKFWGMGASIFIVRKGYFCFVVSSFFLASRDAIKWGF